MCCIGDQTTQKSREVPNFAKPVPPGGGGQSSHFLPIFGARDHLISRVPADGYSRYTGFIRYKHDKRCCGKSHTCSEPYPLNSRSATRKKVLKFSESEKLNFAHFGTKSTEDIESEKKSS